MKKMKLNCAATMEETFSDFLTSRKAKGLRTRLCKAMNSSLEPWRDTWM